MNRKPEKRQTNTEKIKENIESTIHNMEVAQEIIENATDNKTVSELQAKNQRRVEAIPSLIKEYKEEEAKDQLEDIE
jgi:small acid-soluble spore protein tlp